MVLSMVVRGGKARAVSSDRRLKPFAHLQALFSTSSRGVSIAISVSLSRVDIHATRTIGHTQARAHPYV